MKKAALLLSLTAAVLAGCHPDPNIITPAFTTKGVFVLSEGQFGAGDGAVSAFDNTSKTLVVDAFGAANSGSKLGDVVQDMGIVGTRGYVCVNGSRKVEVVSVPDFKSVATIRRIEQPRYFAWNLGTRGYVTSWRGNYTGYLPGKVMVIDLNTNALIDSITVGRCPEKPATLNGSLYVPNSYDNTVSVIDMNTNKVTSTITVADGPGTVVADQTANLWVLCSGFTVYNTQAPYNVISSTPGTLARFAPGSPTNQLKLSFASSGPSRLRISPDQTRLYYSYGKAEYQLSTTATALPATPFIRRSFSGFGIDPADNTIYAAVSPSYSTAGRFVRYPAAGGAAIDSFTVKVGPNGFVFY
ncbi:MAG: YncE family protein [Janthinobacterium lividum]